MLVLGGALVLATALLVHVDPGLACVLPALALTLLLGARRYPGERILVALARARRWRHPASAPPAPRPHVAFPRGGLLLARSLAVRPPPAASLA
jgi:hypothetical protein